MPFTNTAAAAYGLLAMHAVKVSHRRPQPVSARSRTGLRVSKTEIGKTRAETGAQKPADFAPSPNALRARDSADL